MAIVTVILFYIRDTAKNIQQSSSVSEYTQGKTLNKKFTEKKLFYNARYYDQAHFIKEVKNYYGVTPGKAFAR